MRAFSHKPAIRLLQRGAVECLVLERQDFRQLLHDLRIVIENAIRHREAAVKESGVNLDDQGKAAALPVDEESDREVFAFDDLVQVIAVPSPVSSPASIPTCQLDDRNTTSASFSLALLADADAWSGHIWAGETCATCSLGACSLDSPRSACACAAVESTDQRNLSVAHEQSHDANIVKREKQMTSQVPMLQSSASLIPLVVPHLSR